MAVLKVLKYGEPGLRRRASPVGEVTPEIRAVIADMTETMYDEVGIGLAAPQVGISLRLIVIADEEARDVNGQPLAINARGLRARVLQHEIDHLDGVLFIDRVDPVTRDRIKRKIKKDGLREDASRHAFAL